MRSLRLLIPVILCVLLLACSGQTPAPLAQTTAVPENPVTEHAEDIISFANRAAAWTCSGHGAIPAMPTLADLV